MNVLRRIKFWAGQLFSKFVYLDKIFCLGYCGDRYYRLLLVVKWIHGTEIERMSWERGKRKQHKNICDSRKSSPASIKPLFNSFSGFDDTISMPSLALILHTQKAQIWPIRFVAITLYRNECCYYFPRTIRKSLTEQMHFMWSNAEWPQ